MTCKQCIRFDECKENPAMHDRIWLIGFWENAERRCRKFKRKNAHWYINPDGYYPQCSNCNEEPESGELESICPTCGAFMTGTR